ncbi:hypothetical protein [uncultured Marixanthomonas sp.]|uniref:hypothetical protein n=1 Tax=uncultured Marixanthomonas sp. TaxID=757245 RepID=UPI0030DB87BF|tara:strand:- start:1775 stop:4420 length:2646 start_codon:yes stop_codon:yes gene_type:complete
MAKKISLFFILTSVFAYSQQKITGKVYNNKTSEPLSNVIASIFSGDSIIAYGKTNAKGEFVIASKKAKNVTIVFRKNGFESFKTEIKKPIGAFYYLIPEQEKPEYLEEVILKSEKSYIRTKDDTVTYGANKLRNNTSTTVEDLIQNIPEIAIDELTGTIRYRNKEISNILIDGDDITGKDYQIISKNLGEEAAKAIQVIEGYTENEVLKNFERDNKVALNLKTEEKYRNKLKGNSKLGYGVEDRYNMKTTLISISEKLKTINTVGYNNVGEFSLGNIVSSKNLQNNQQPLLNSNELNFIHLKGSYDNQLRLSLFNTLNILENSDFTVSTNQAYKFDKDSKLKSNITYYNDKISSITSEALLPYRSGIDIFNNQNSRNKRENFKVGLEFSKNYSDREKLLLRTQFKNKNRLITESGVQNDVPFKFSGEINNPEVRFMADYTKKLGNKAALVLFNNTSISQIEENDIIENNYNLFFLDSLQTGFIEQNIGYRVFKSNFGVNYAYKFSTNNIITTALLFTNYNQQSNINFTTAFFEDDSVYTRKLTNLSPQLHWSLFKKHSNISILAKASILNNDWDASNSANVEFTPDVQYAFRKITSEFNELNFNFQFQRKISFYDFFDRSKVALLKDSNYFYLNNNQDNLYYLSNNFGLNAFYGFDKIGLEVSAGLQYDFGKKPLIDNLVFYENYYLNEVVEKENKFKNLKIQFGFNKFFKDFFSTVELLPSYSYKEYDNIVSSNRVFNNIHNYRIRLNLGTSLSNSIQVSLGALYNYTLSRQENGVNGSTKTHISNFSGYFNTGLTLFSKKLTINIENEYINYDTSEGFLYSSILSKYKPKSSKFEFGFSLKNLFNNESFSSRNVTTNFLYEKEVSVIPRLAVVSVNYVF